MKGSRQEGKSIKVLSMPTAAVPKAQVVKRTERGLLNGEQIVDPRGRREDPSHALCSSVKTLLIIYIFY